jgi:hypothetical protein
MDVAAARRKNLADPVQCNVVGFHGRYLGSFIAQ